MQCPCWIITYLNKFNSNMLLCLGIYYLFTKELAEYFTHFISFKSLNNL